MNTNRNTALTVIRIVVWIFLIGAALISTSHIVHTAQMLGLGWEAYTVPAFVDGIAIVGKISMLPRFSDAFRRSGFKLLMFGGLLSLACNVAAGSNWGERAFGVLVVAGFMILESHATKATRTAVAAPGRKLDPQVAAERTAKARITKERNRLAQLTPGQKAAETRKRNAAAPVSPAGPVTGSVPTVAEVAAIAS